eukprot:1216364-Pyramimonas_sp.AAC.1
MPSQFHIEPDKVDNVMSGLIQHTLVALPAVWVQESGIDPNIGDKRQPKVLWIGRVRHLALLLAAEGLRKLTNAKAIRITLTQFANQRYVDDANNPDAMMLVSIIELDDDELELLAKVGQNCQLMDSSS